MAEQVAEVVSTMTGIPTTKITEDESRFKPQIISLKEAEKIKDDSKIEKFTRFFKFGIIFCRK